MGAAWLTSAGATRLSLPVGLHLRRRLSGARLPARRSYCPMPTPRRCAGASVSCWSIPTVGRSPCKCSRPACRIATVRGRCYRPRVPAGRSSRLPLRTAPMPVCQPPGRNRQQRRHPGGAQAARPGRVRGAAQAVGGGAVLRLAGPQPETCKGLRDPHANDRSLPLRRLIHHHSPKARALLNRFGQMG